MTSPVIAALLGLVTGLSLIIAIGAQNAYVLRLGVTAPRRTMLPVVVICSLSDALLILGGALGVGLLVQNVPVVMEILRWLGALFLLTYGVLAARRVFHPRAIDIESAPPVPMRVALVSVLAFTWLNPHTYLDTIVFLGSVANQQADEIRGWWIAGAIVASFVWFSALGFGARWLRPLFRKARAWQVLDALIAVVMLALGARLVLGV